MRDNDQHHGAISPQLDRMVCELIGLVLDELAGGRDPGVVVCLEDATSRRREVSFCDDSEEECLAAAERFVIAHAEESAGGSSAGAHGRVERYAIAYAGGVEIEGSFRDALLVSFFERGLQTGFSAYVLYRGAGAGADFIWSDPEPAGEEPPLIEDSTRIGNV